MKNAVSAVIGQVNHKILRMHVNATLAEPATPQENRNAFIGTAIFFMMMSGISMATGIGSLVTEVTTQGTQVCGVIKAIYSNWVMLAAVGVMVMGLITWINSQGRRGMSTMAMGFAGLIIAKIIPSVIVGSGMAGGCVL